jgi:hypothetical protein
MRKQINGLSQAEDNTKNGISLIQTAEGGLNETSAILQRMNTLAVESSNGTYKDADRAEPAEGSQPPQDRDRPYLHFHKVQRNFPSGRLAELHGRFRSFFRHRFPA